MMKKQAVLSLTIATSTLERNITNRPHTCGQRRAYIPQNRLMCTVPQILCKKGLGTRLGKFAVGMQLALDQGYVPVQA